MQQSFLVLHDIRIDSWRAEVEQHLRLALQVSKVRVGIAPVNAVVGDGTVLGKQGEIDHVLSCLLVVERLGCPDAYHFGERCACKAIGEVDGMVFPMHQVPRAHQHDAPVAAPSEGAAHIGYRHTEPTVVASQDMRVAHTLAEGYGIAAYYRLSVIQGRIVETVVAHGIAYLLLLGCIACEIDKEIMGGRQCRSQYCQEDVIHLYKEFIVFKCRLPIRTSARYRVSGHRARRRD